MSTDSSARLCALFPAHKSAALLCSRKVWVIPPTHHSRGRFCAPHRADPRFHLGVAVHPIHNRFIVHLDLQSQFLSRNRCSKVNRGGGERRRSLGFFVGTGPPNSFFLSTGCFIDSNKLRITSSLRNRVCVNNYSFPCSTHLAIGVSHWIPLLWNHVIPQEGFSTPRSNEETS